MPTTAMTLHALVQMLARTRPYDFEPAPKPVPAPKPQPAPTEG